MAIKIGINGYGRIGRNIVRAIHEYGRAGEFFRIPVDLREFVAQLLDGRPEHHPHTAEKRHGIQGFAAEYPFNPFSCTEL